MHKCLKNVIQFLLTKQLDFLAPLRNIAQNTSLRRLSLGLSVGSAPHNILLLNMVLSSIASVQLEHMALYASFSNVESVDEATCRAVDPIFAEYLAGSGTRLKRVAFIVTVANLEHPTELTQAYDFIRLNLKKKGLLHISSSDSESAHLEFSSNL